MKACAFLLLLVLGTVACLAADPDEKEKAEVLRLLAEKRYVDLDAHLAEAAKHRPPFYGGRPRLAKIYRHLSDLPRSEPDRFWANISGKSKSGARNFPLQLARALSSAVHGSNRRGKRAAAGGRVPLEIRPGNCSENGWRRRAKSWRVRRSCR